MEDFLANWEEKIKNFDFNTVTPTTPNNKTETKQENTPSASSEAVELSKRAKEADNKFNRKTKASYASNYEKALITISEKQNGEI